MSLDIVPVFWLLTSIAMCSSAIPKKQVSSYTSHNGPTPSQVSRANLHTLSINLASHHASSNPAGSLPSQATEHVLLVSKPKKHSTLVVCRL